MSRYTTLYKTPENLYTENSPVVISAGALLKDNDTNKILVQLKFRNIYDKTVKAVKVEIISYSVDKEELAERKETQYLDLTAAYDVEFGQKQPVFLTDNTARSFDVICKSVVFTDQSKWENTDNSVFTPTAYPQEIKSKIAETDSFTKFIDFAEQEDLKDNTNIFWQNHNKEELNNQLNFLKDNIVYARSELAEKVKNTIEQYTKLLSAERKSDGDFSEEEIKVIDSYDELKFTLETVKNKAIKKNKIIVVITATIIILVSVFLFVFSTVIMPALNYNKAVSLMENGDFDMAIAIFEELDEYKDSEKMITNVTNEKIYKEALNCLENGNFYTAIDLFESIIDYKDSNKKLIECKYNLATYYFENKEYSDAEKLFKELDYNDSYLMQLYCNARDTEQDSIISAYSMYTYIVSIGNNFKYLNKIQERIKLIEEYLPYTGTFVYSSGAENIKSVTGEDLGKKYRSWVLEIDFLIREDKSGVFIMAKDPITKNGSDSLVMDPDYEGYDFEGSFENACSIHYSKDSLFVSYLGYKIYLKRAS